MKTTEPVLPAQTTETSKNVKHTEEKVSHKVETKSNPEKQDNTKSTKKKKKKSNSKINGKNLF